jgi:phytoene dehydrogenase-like protein
MKKAYDVIIVGGGHNGLVTSAYLARQGLRVLVCEKRSIIGGAACTEEIVKDYKFSRASYLLSLFREKIITDLNLREYGLKYYFRDPCSYTPIKKPINNNQRSLLLSSTDNQFNTKQIAKFSIKDAENYHKYEEWLTKICRTMDQLIQSRPPDLSQMTKTNPISKRYRAYNYSFNIFYNLFKKLGLNGSIDLYQLLTSPASKVLDKWFESDIIKATLATDGLIGAMLGPYDSGTGYILLHQVMGGLDGRASKNSPGKSLDTYNYF